MSDEAGPLVLVERRGAVGVVTLNRPGARNALSKALLSELRNAMCSLDDDHDVGAIVLTGGNKHFSAGADIKEMTSKSFAEAYLEDFVTRDTAFMGQIRTPVIAAIAGPALGGGCEFALMCDIIVADETAIFGQPEVGVGTLPGGGGTQRLARLVGKHVAMELCLTGRTFSAHEAKDMRFVSQVVPAGSAATAALAMAERIAGFSRPVVLMIKEAVSRAFEGTLSDGLQFERRLLHASFALEDQKEAMTAFAERRAPHFRHR
jgi:enoyl-CoA hydratase